MNTLVKEQVTRSRRSRTRGRTDGMMMTLYSDSTAACFTAFNPTTKKHVVKKCPDCNRVFQKGDLAFVSPDLSMSIHTKCLLALSELVIEGATTNAEAELMLARRRIEETGRFHG